MIRLLTGVPGMEISNNDMCDILVGEYGRKADVLLYEKEPAVGCFDEYGYARNAYTTYFGTAR